MKQQDWTEQLRQRLEAYEEPVAEDLWTDIERRMSPKAIIPRHARLVALRRWAAAAAACALLTVGLWELTKQASSTTPASTSIQSREEASAAVPTTPAISSTPAKLSIPFTPTTPTAHSTATTPSTPTRPSTPSAPSTPASPSAPSTPASPTTPATPPHTTKSAKPTYPTPGAKPTPHTPLQLSLHASNLLVYGGTADTEPLLMTPSYMGPVSQALARTAPVYLTDYEDQADHKLPFTVGLSLRLPLSRRLWVASGIDYSLLTSTFTHRMGTSTRSIGQRLHYIGVPLSAGYTFWQTPRLSVYASGGAEALLNVKTHVDEGRLDRDHMQFSLLGSAGIEYTLLPRLGIYVQPGVRFYPDNGSRIQNIYKERPLQFDLQLGLRCTLK